MYAQKICAFIVFTSAMVFSVHFLETTAKEQAEANTALASMDSPSEH